MFVVYGFQWSEAHPEKVFRTEQQMKKVRCSVRVRLASGQPVVIQVRAQVVLWG